jgi:hypothetical protein
MRLRHWLDRVFPYAWSNAATPRCCWRSSRATSERSVSQSILRSSGLICPSGGQEPVDAQDAERFRRDRFHLETPGFYLHRDRFQGGVGRAGCTVLVIAQGSVIINIRRSSPTLD